MLSGQKSANRRRSFVLLMTSCFGAALCLTVFGYRAFRQGERNYALSEAVGSRDARAICRLLREGADPKAPWSGYRLRDQLDRMLKREPWVESDPSILEWARNDPEITQLLKTSVSKLPSDATLAVQEHRSRLEKRLFIAAELGDNATVGMLLDQGLSVNTRDVNERTPLICAVNGRRASTVTLLLSRGANVNAQTCSGLSVLANAFVYGGSRLSAQLLKAGAKVNVQDHYGNTPLIEATRGGGIAVVRLLLKNGADPNLHPTNGPGALDWALQYRNQKVIAELKRAGAREFRKPEFPGG